MHIYYHQQQKYVRTYNMALTMKKYNNMPLVSIFFY